MNKYNSALYKLIQSERHVCKVHKEVKRATINNFPMVQLVNCKDCSEFYIGMTCRRLEQRIGEHSTSVSSAVLQHMTSLGHDVAFNDPQILAHDKATKRISLLTRTQALMNVPYGNPHGPIVDCCTLHFSMYLTHMSF